MRKITAQYIFTNVTKPLKFGILHVDEKGCIRKITDTKGKLNEEANLEFYNGIICPGFVNAHCHIELSHLKNKITPQSGMAQFIKQLIKNRLNFSLEERQQYMYKADNELKNNGVVVVGDISNTEESIRIKKDSTIYYHTFHETYNVKGLKTEQIINYTEAIIEKFENYNLPGSICPHTAYSVSKVLFNYVKNYINNNKGIVSIHNQESKEEIELFKGKNSELNKLINVKNHFNYTSSLSYAMQYIKHANRILLVHNTYTSELDIEKNKGYLDYIYWVLCPNSNLYIENKLPNINLIQNYTGNIAIGTDSYASNTKLSVLEELKTIAANFPDIKMEELIKWATINGAKALGLNHKYGSFEVGKIPGINLLTNVDLHNMKFLENTSVKVLA